MARLRVTSVCAFLVLLGSAAPAAAAAGDVMQLGGTLGCTHHVNSFGCAAGTSLDQPEGVAVSPDGRNAYVASVQSDAITVFDRDEATGTMTQKPNPDGCISPDGSGGTCRSTGGPLNGTGDVVVTPDGKHVLAGYPQGVAVLARDAPTGNLTAAGCVNDTGTMGCFDGKLGGGSFAVAVSPDGRNVYTASSSAVSTLDRDPVTGAVTQQTAGTTGCISETGSGGACVDGKALDSVVALTVSPDGKAVYATSLVSDGVAILDRDAATGALTQKSAPGAGCVTDTGTGGACAVGRHVGTSFGMALSPDGEHAYITSRDAYAVAIFDRDPATNALTQLPGASGCITLGSDPTCATGRAFTFPTAVDVSPDGRTLYVSSQDFAGVAVFDRDVTTGALTQKAGDAACVSGLSGVGCRPGRAMAEAWDVAVNPDGKSVYVAGRNADALAVLGRETPAPAGGGSDPGPVPGGGDPSPGGTPAPTAPTSTAAAASTATTPPATPRPTAPPRPSDTTTIRVSTRPGNGSVELQIGTTGPGQLTVTATAPVVVSSRPRHATAARTVTLRVARVSRRVTRAGKVKLVLRPTKQARRILQRRGSLKAKLTIAFKPAGATRATTRRRSATFRLRRG